MSCFDLLACMISIKFYNVPLHANDLIIITTTEATTILQLHGDHEAK